MPPTTGGALLNAAHDDTLPESIQLRSSGWLGTLALFARVSFWDS